MCVWRDQRMTSISADENGQVEIELPEGTYDLVVSAKGYLSMLLRGIGVLAGHRTDVMRGLIPGEGHGEDEPASTAVGGFVKDRLGHPLPNLLVQAVTRTQSIIETGKVYAARTDRFGAYVIHGIGYGDYELVVRAAERLITKEGLEVHDVKHFVRHDVQVMR